MIGLCPHCWLCGVHRFTIHRRSRKYVQCHSIDSIQLYNFIVLFWFFITQARFSSFLPLTILGLLALIGAVVGLMLPETLGAILPETIEDGENFGKDQSFWDFPCCQRPKEYAIFFVTFIDVIKTCLVNDFLSKFFH